MRKPEKKFIDPAFFLKPYLYKSLFAVEKGTFAAQDIYDKYRKRLMMAALSKFYFSNKDVLQVGLFSGDYLKMIAKKKPKSIFGIGIFHELVMEVRKELESENVDVSQFNGKMLPFPDGVFDVVFSAAFLQNIGESKIAKTLLAEMARVSNQQIIIIEDIYEPYLKTEYFRGREPKFFIDFLEKMGYKLKMNQALNIGGTDKMRQLLRNYFNPKGLEIAGAPLSPQAKKIEKMLFPIANSLDGMMSGGDGLRILVFEKPVVEFY